MLRAKAVRITTGLLILLMMSFFYQNCSSGFVPDSLIKQSSTYRAGLPTPTPEPTPPSGTPGLYATRFLDLNPFKASGNPSLPYGADFSPFLQPTNLKNLNSSANYLTNGRIALDVDDAYPTQIAKPNDNLYVAASNPKFLQANTYFHLDRFLAGLAADGAGPATAPLVHINTHCQNSNAVNNAYFEPTTMTICLGYANPNGMTVWGAHDADVSVHEFGHSINHALSTTDIMSSTLDLATLDEGFSDAWAYLNNQNPYIAAWYGRAMYTALGLPLAGFKGLRDLTTVPSYPTYLLGLWHDDSIGMSSVIYELHQARGVSLDKLKKLVSRVLSDLQVNDNFAQVSRYMIQESSAVGIDPDLVQSALNSRGFYRKDNVASLSLASASDVLVIDNHYYDLTSYSQKGNCNRQLDVGETALVVVNLTNTAATTLGGVRANIALATSTTGISILSGSDANHYLRFNPSAKFTNSLISAAVDSSTRRMNTGFAGFFLRARTAGTYSFNLTLTGYDSIDTTPTTKTIPFSVTVGTQPNISALCPGSGEDSVWP